MKANTMKGSATPEELKAFARYFIDKDEEIVQSL
jgi:hypothetical protein